MTRMQHARIVSTDEDALPPPFSKGSWVSAAAGLVVGLGLFVFLFVWYGCRIEPESGEIAILIRKTGTDLPNGQILALAPDQKGIQLDVLSEGRYFYNPYRWGWKIHPITDIPAGRLGVVTHMYGDEIAPGEILAREGTKGILEEPLRPGKYRINPYAYRVNLYDAMTIRPGRVGVVTQLIGQDPLSDALPDDARNTFLVKEDLKGVRRNVLDPGTYYLNPYLVSVVEVNLQSQRFEMSGEDVITFLTQDGFTIRVEGTLEFSLNRGHSALLTHRVGDMDDILTKLILPRARGFSRIEGSKHPAINFIIGETRQQFQNNLEAHLTEKLEGWGIAIHSVLIRNILPPDEIASIIRDREVAVQNARMFEQQILQAKSEAELKRQEMLALQNKERVVAETARIRAVIHAEQEQDVNVTAAKRELEVAGIQNEAADAQVAAIRAQAEAQRDVIRMANEAEAGVIRTRVQAFGSGQGLARYAFYKTVAPKIHRILSSDQDTGLGAILDEFRTGRADQ